jgi:two-component system chemotaxis sensor kinase CheA
LELKRFFDPSFSEKETVSMCEKAEKIKDTLQPETSKVKAISPEKVNEKQPDTSKRKEGEFVATSIRVPSAKLDALVDLVSELVTIQAGLSQTAESRNDSELLMIAEEVERLTSELRDNTMGIRMLDIGTLFSKFKRLVRDLSTQIGKKIDITTEGEETELDKTVIEQLNDPLLHLIRNSIDHGIESAEDRVAAGKPEKGAIRLTASQAGSDVLIRLSDDGKGLDCEAIKRKARERGFMGATEELPESKLYEFLFMPGFSTAPVVTNLSGRGVGLDVVKRSLGNLRGTLDLESKKGEGTTFTMKLPLTLAIIDGLLVIIGNQYFVLPLVSVVECVELTRNDIEEGHGRRVANVRGELIPYVNLKDRFMISGERLNIEQIVITGSNEKRVGFVVDKVVGKHQTVIKALGRVYRDIEGVSGATILGDGTVALILDIPNLIKGVEKEEIHTRR